MTPATGHAVETAMLELTQLLGRRANDTAAVRDHHSHGESYHPPAPPDIVCFPHTTEEVAEILKISARLGVPVVPFGAGTSLEGHVNAIHGGISIDLREMHTILRVSVDDLDATVQAGVTRLQLNKALNNTGLTFPVDPGADATIGGMTATRASGTTAVRYGTMRENVLGVITEITLRLHPLPEAVSAAVCPFDTIKGAVETVIATIQLGVPVARIELLDETQVDAVNRYSKTSYPVAPTLFFEFHSDSERHVAEQAAAVQAIAAEHGGHSFEWATHLEDRERLWQARHHAMYAAVALRPGARPWTTDVCVPISRLAECVVDTKKDNQDAPFPICLVGHAGDGNFHLIYVLDPDSPAEIEEARRLNERMILRALAMGGTCSGEHGVGIGKMKYLEIEHGAGLEVMRTIKRALDPDNRMNPGKMIDICE